ncbi:Proline iminopeptidase [Colletotrichum sp. SAR 10_70]|nr:Proline iminopeptidase [Colletotrichum sp. SAR 10_71]KAI8187305.1 Proline iminopeptidase [Colletotrichum sp. SAR 10_75]KAI8204804.1 Proline iminopeptidase [Colletotrichum sp. SAR 10_70]KAI8211955.1 Proline iminopeptidase [Colletotrichum sp. SAR 10_76]KAJ5003699.1 Proline iminopeptidase [Colletotrichum sp. SAR 10_66]
MAEYSAVKLSDGASVQVKLLGDTDKTKPLLIALHGAPGLSDHREPESSFGFLASNFRVLVYDARGSGESDLKPPYTDARWVADVDELRKWAGAEKFILAGGSYGGFVSLQYAIAHPDRLLALVLRDTWANGLRGSINFLKNILTSDRIQPDADRQVRLVSGGVRSNEDFANAFAEIVGIYTPKNGSTDSKSASSTFEGNVVAETHLLHYETHNFAFSHNIPRFDVRSKLKDITAPTLVATGRLDVVVPVGYGEEISQGIPQSELVIFEKSGHSPPSDEPVLFQKTVTEFLAKWIE